jgi:hypothetical protein
MLAISKCKIRYRRCFSSVSENVRVTLWTSPWSTPSCFPTKGFWTYEVLRFLGRRSRKSPPLAAWYFIAI